MEKWLELNRALMERNIEVWEKMGRLEARLQWFEERSCYGGNQSVGNEPCRGFFLHRKAPERVIPGLCVRRPTDGLLS